jgi:hypothetical protein
MGKYAGIETDIFSVFANNLWKAENIKTLPSNFLGVNVGTEYIRVNVVTGGPGINLKSASGVLMIDIFTPAGSGTRRPSLIADKLDQYFSGKSFNTTSGAVTQLFGSTLQHRGVDKDSSALHRSIYAIPFNYYGT